MLRSNPVNVFTWEDKMDTRDWSSAKTGLIVRNEETPAILPSIYIKCLAASAVTCPRGIMCMNKGASKPLFLSSFFFSCLFLFHFGGVVNLAATSRGRA